ncbi:MAG: YihY/virulence factor BrkB family protein [Cyclobacteriaceae bacterium]
MSANQFAKLKSFLEVDLWKIKIGRLPKGRAFLYRQLRIWVITITEFNKDKCGEKASALTYFSVLSVVPVIAMAVGVASIFGLRKYLESELKNYLAGQEEVMSQILEFADNMLSDSSGGVVTGISAVFLIYAVTRLFNNIEMAFNNVWNTKKGRSLKRKMTDYMSVILLGPLILILSSSATVFISTSIQDFTDSISLFGFIKPVILFFINLIPYTLIWFLLFLTYVIFPNTSVKLRPALIAGVLAGTAFQFTQFAWIEGQVLLSKYDTIYGGLAALPLFLIWLQLSWTILLFGAEFAFAVQNVDTWSYDNEDLTMTVKSKRKFTLLVLRSIVVHFEHNGQAVSFEQLCTELNIPRRFIREILEELLLTKLVVRLATDTEDEEFQPGMDIHQLDVFTVYDRLERIGLDNLPQAYDNVGFEKIETLMNEVDAAIRSAQANKKIKDL